MVEFKWYEISTTEVAVGRRHKEKTYGPWDVWMSSSISPDDRYPLLHVVHQVQEFLNPFMFDEYHYQYTRHSMVCIVAVGRIQRRIGDLLPPLYPTAVTLISADQRYGQALLGIYPTNQAILVMDVAAYMHAYGEDAFGAVAYNDIPVVAGTSKEEVEALLGMRYTQLFSKPIRCEMTILSNQIV